MKLIFNLKAQHKRCSRCAYLRDVGARTYFQCGILEKDILKSEIKYIYCTAFYYTALNHRLRRID